VRDTREEFQNLGKKEGSSARHGNKPKGMGRTYGVKMRFRGIRHNRVSATTKRLPLFWEAAGKNGGVCKGGCRSKASVRTRNKTSTGIRQKEFNINNSFPPGKGGEIAHSGRVELGVYKSGGSRKKKGGRGRSLVLGGREIVGRRLPVFEMHKEEKRGEVCLFSK